MALITLTTVGYREVHPLSGNGRLFNSVFMMMGVTSIFISIGVLADTVLNLELGDYFGRNRRRKMIDKLSDHYIVCGAGRVGRAVVEELRHTGASLVVVDTNPEKLVWVDEMGLPVLIDDATKDETLTTAHIERARGLVSAIGSDAENVYVTLSARGLNPELVIAARATSDEAAAKLRRAGATIVLTPYTFIGRRLAQSILRPEVVSFLDDASSLGGKKLDLDIEQMRVSNGSRYASLSLSECRLSQNHGVMVLAVRKPAGGLRFNPTGDTRIEPGDMLIAMGERSQLKKVEAELGG